MALKKDIRQDDGVVTSYHRILFLDIVTNSHNSIAVLSYIDNAARIDEKDVTLKDEVPYQPYKKSITYETDYDPTMNIEKAYDYVKSLPEFEGATDV